MPKASVCLFRATDTSSQQWTARLIWVIYCKYKYKLLISYFPSLRCILHVHYGILKSFKPSDDIHMDKLFIHFL